MKRWALMAVAALTGCGASPASRPPAASKPKPAEDTPMVVVPSGDETTPSADTADAPPRPKAEEPTDDRPPSALALVIDRSGSMHGAPIEMTREACHMAIDELDERDRILVVAFDSRPHVLVPFAPVGDGTAAHRGVDSLRAAGGTHILPALEAAFTRIQSGDGELRPRLLLLSDGQAPRKGIVERVRAMREKGWLVSTIGLGTSFDRQLLENIAKRGGGRFHTVSSATALPRTFRDEVAELVSADDTTHRTDR